jgi:uncharacterized LabA/DUF88 family protein
MPNLQKVAVVIDYQNVQMTAHDVFQPSLPLHESLIDPLRFSRSLIEVKNDDIEHSNTKKGKNYPKCELSRVEVYRGIPKPEADPDGYSRNQAQMAAWKKEAFLQNFPLTVEYRPLKYHNKFDNGKRVIDTSFKPQEKGIDVLCALAVTRLARSGDFDIVILASRDTDLAPALDEAHSYGVCRVEAVKWYSPTYPHTRGHLPIKQDWKLWTTSMIEEDFKESLDRHSYESI